MFSKYGFKRRNSRGYQVQLVKSSITEKRVQGVR